MTCYKIMSDYKIIVFKYNGREIYAVRPEPDWDKTFNILNSHVAKKMKERLINPENILIEGIDLIE